MDRIRMLCEGQNREARRRILAAYYLGAVDGFRECPQMSAPFPWYYVPRLTRHGASYEISNRWHLSPLRGAPKRAAQTILLAMPCGLDARMAKSTPADHRAEIQRQLSILRQRLSEAWQTDPEAVPRMRGRPGPDAPRGLQQAAGGDVAVQAVPPGGSQRKPRITTHIPLLRHQAE